MHRTHNLSTTKGLLADTFLLLSGLAIVVAVIVAHCVVSHGHTTIVLCYPANLVMQTKVRLACALFISAQLCAVGTCWTLT